MARLVLLAGVGLLACGGSTAGAGGSAADAGSSLGNGSGTGTGTGTGSDSGSDTSSDAGKDGALLTHLPLIHRAVATACSHVRGPGDAQPIMNQPCAVDADCTSGDNGRCLVTKVAARLDYCSYDTCFQDSDCAGAAGAATVCTCREFPSDANRCEPGNCKVDADCGAGSYCSPSVDPDKTNFGFTGWWCHTKNDSCVDDTDCPGDSKQAAGKCAYDPKTAHWACSSIAFLPP